MESFYTAGLFAKEWRFEVFAPPAESLTRDFLREYLADSRGRTVAALAGLTEAELVNHSEVPGIPVQWPLRSWLWYLVEHEIHHKAQLALYLHTLGLEAPFWAFPLPPGVRPDKRSPNRE